MIKVLLVVPFLTPYATALSSLSGTVQDSSKGSIDGAGITLVDVVTSKSLETSSSAGSFSFNGVQPGDYWFKVEKGNMAPVYGALHLADIGSHEIAVVMLPVAGNNADLSEAGFALRNAFRAPRTSAKPPKVKPAQVKKKVKPVYPNTARLAGVRGTVKIAAIILPDGTLDDLVVVSAPDTSLALNALLAVRQWHYSPTYLDGQAVEASLTIDVDFEP